VALIVDTGPLVAMLDATDPDHERCAELLQEADEADRKADEVADLERRT
jgi:predicted nucleic acid-binding protein